MYLTGVPYRDGAPQFAKAAVLSVHRSTESYDVLLTGPSGGSYSIWTIPLGAGVASTKYLSMRERSRLQNRDLALRTYSADKFKGHLC